MRIYESRDEEALVLPLDLLNLSDDSVLLPDPGREHPLMTDIYDIPLYQRSHSTSILESIEITVLIGDHPGPESHTSTSL